MLPSCWCSRSRITGVATKPVSGAGRALQAAARRAPPAAGTVSGSWNSTWSGQRTPSSSSRLVATSSTSTSSITSASARSWAAISRSASRTASGVSLMMMQIQLLVDEDVAGLHQRADHVRRLLHVGVGEIEAAHHELLVLALLRGRVREHEDGALVQDLLLELVGEQHDAQRLLDGRVAHQDRRAQVGRAGPCRRRS